MAELPVGDSSKPPLLLVPGLSGSCEALSAASEEMFRAFRLIPSFHPIRAASDTVEDLTDRVESLLPKAEPTFVCGESFGGTIALTLARRHPERVRGLILLSAFARLPKAGTLRARALVALWAGVVQHAPLVAYGARVAGLPAQFGQGVPLNRTLMYVREPLAPGPDYRHKVRLIADFDARPWLNEIRCPSIVVLGRRDPIVPPWAGRELGRLLPACTVRELDCGHLSYLAAPSRVRDAVAQWRNEIASVSYGVRQT